MRRGTTPTLTFTTPYTDADIEYGYVTFEQRGAVLFSVQFPDGGASLNNGTVTVPLTQEQTLTMSAAAKCRVQIRAMLQSGKAVASDIKEFDVCNILKDGEI